MPSRSRRSSCTTSASACWRTRSTRQRRQRLDRRRPADGADEALGRRTPPARPSTRSRCSNSGIVEADVAPRSPPRRATSGQRSPVQLSAFRRRDPTTAISSGPASTASAAASVQPANRGTCVAMLAADAMPDSAAVAVAVLARDRREREQRCDGGRRCRTGTRCRTRPWGVRRGVSASSAVSKNPPSAIREVVDDPVEQQPGPIEPHRVAGDAEDRDERLGDGAVILQHRRVGPGDTVA